jgi:hypothetical protein
MVVRFFSIVENKKTAIIASHTANVADWTATPIYVITNHDKWWWYSITKYDDEDGNDGQEREYEASGKGAAVCVN